MTDPPSTGKATRPPHQPWQRFTLLDALLLQAGAAMGFSAMHFAVGPWQSDRDTGALVGWVGAGTVLGIVLAGPLVLGVQSFLRGRREPLSSGEWLWLWQSAPVALVVLELALRGRLPGERSQMVTFPLALIVVPLIPALSVRSLWLLCVGLRRRPQIPCPWTDWIGLTLSLVTGGTVLLLALLAVL
jgi:hypothetical protein